MKTHARVVIVGGGMMGAGLLYHLAKEGWSDCVLVEKAELTSGSTWHAAGQCAHFMAGYNVAKIHDYGIKLYPTLEDETGQSVTWHRCGGLRIANSTEELEWFKYALGVARSLGYPMELIGPEEIRRIHPFYKTDGVLAAAHTTEDGHVDPAGVCNALAQGARQMGATVVRRNRVVDIKRRENGEWQVFTEQGNIIAEQVVNAAGCYARQVGAWVALDVPITNMQHQYVVTDTVPEFQERDTEVPVIRDTWVGAYIRQEQMSGLIGVYEKYGSSAVWRDGPPWEAESELFEPDLDRIAPWVNRAMERMPILKELGIKRVVHGAITHSPDGNMLLGPAPGLRNFWLACGASIGVAQGGGAGKYLAQWMIHGQAEINMNEFDPRRFGPYADQDYTFAKSTEDFEHMFAVHMPGENRPGGRPVKTSPIYGRLEGHGAVFGDVFVWERAKWFAPKGMPREDEVGIRRVRWFEPVAEECRTVHERVGILDLTAFAKYDVSGPGAEAFLNRVCANRVSRRDGGIVLAHMLTADGAIQSELTITRFGPERFYLLSSAAAQVRDLDWLDHHRGADREVVIDDVTESYGCLVVTGPQSRALLGRLCDADLGNDAFRWLSGREINVCGVPCRALRISYTGELGWELHVPMGNMPQVYDGVWEAGREFGMANIGTHALNALRMEKAYRGWGTELTNEITLVEADMLRFANFDKGDFIGREATLKRYEEGVEIRLVYLSVDADVADSIGAEPVYANERVVGVTTSGGYGHAVEQSLAFAYVAPAFAAPGTELEVLILGDKRAARVRAEPTYDAHNARLRA